MYDVVCVAGFWSRCGAQVWLGYRPVWSVSHNDLPAAPLRPGLHGGAERTLPPEEAPVQAPGAGVPLSAGVGRRPQL